MSETVYIHRAPVEGSDGPVGVVFTTHGAAVVYTGLEVHTEKDAPLLEEIEALGEKFASALGEIDEIEHTGEKTE